jgi:hypothetical protein
MTRIGKNKVIENSATIIEDIIRNQLFVEFGYSVTSFDPDYDYLSEKYIKIRVDGFGINALDDAFINAKLINSNKTKPNLATSYQIDEANFICLFSSSDATGTDFICRVEVLSYSDTIPSGTTTRTQPYNGDTSTTGTTGSINFTLGGLEDKDYFIYDGDSFRLLNLYIATNDKIKILNTKDLVIDKTSFDLATTARTSWKFARQLETKTSAENVLNQLCFESWTLLNFSEGTYKLIPFNNATETTSEVWTTPTNSNGVPMVKVGQTSLDAIYTDYTFDYAWHSAKGKYSKQKTIKRSQDASCQTAYEKYKQSKTYSLAVDWIQDDTTMDSFIACVIRWHTKRRAIVEWSGEFKNYCKYDIGDKVKLNNTMIPNALSNTAVFMITDKRINFKNGDPFIDFKLIEVS